MKTCLHFRASDDTKAILNPQLAVETKTPEFLLWSLKSIYLRAHRYFVFIFVFIP
jgi:hypothetical protein